MSSNIRSLIPLYLVILLWGAGSGLMIPVFPLYIRSLGFSIEEWGALVMVYALSTFIFEWAWGALSDRADRRIFIALGLLCGAILVPLYTLRALQPFFYILQFLRGSLFIMVGPAVKAMVSDTASSEGLGLSMGLYSASRRLGGVLGPLIGSYIAQFWSSESALYFYSLISLIGAIVTVAGVRIKDGGETLTEARPPSPISEWRYLFSTYSTLVLFMIPVIIFVVRTAISSYLPIYAAEAVGMSTMGVGIMFSVSNIAGLLTTPLFGWFSDRVGRRRVVLSGFLLSTIMSFGLFFAETPVQLTLATVAFGLFFSPLTPLFLATLTEVTPHGLLGAAMGFYSTFENLGIVVSPPIYSMLWSVHAPRTVFLFSASTQVLGILLILSIRGRHKRK